jgi:hypothetical protein
MVTCTVLRSRSSGRSGSSLTRAAAVQCQARNRRQQEQQQQQQSSGCFHKLILQARWKGLDGQLVGSQQRDKGDSE